MRLFIGQTNKPKGVAFMPNQKRLKTKGQTITKNLEIQVAIN